MNRKDHYFRKAKKENYRARSAYKLKEINKKYDIIKKGDCVVDLGAWPGSWIQLVLDILKGEVKIIGIDKKKINKLADNVKLIEGDVFDDKVIDKIDEKVDVVLSDLAPNTSGNRDIDQYKSYELSDRAFKISVKLLKPHGNFLCKIFQSEYSDKLIKDIKKKFVRVHVIVPKATRKRSKEIYIIAKNRKS